MFTNFINSAEMIEAEEIADVVSAIMEIFARKKMSYSTACYILEATKNTIEDYSIVQSLDRRKS